MQNNYTPTTRQEVEINIGMEATQILKTVLLLDKPCGASTLTSILRGSFTDEARIEKFHQLETYGVLSKLYNNRIEDLIYCLLGIGHLRVANEEFGTLEISEIGRQFMDSPEMLVVFESDVRRNWFKNELYDSLRTVRKQLADQESKMPYEIFSNFAMRRISDVLPTSDSELINLPGMRKVSLATRNLILKATQQVLERKEFDDRTGLIRKSFQTGAREVKALVMEGKSLKEMAQSRNVKNISIVYYLKALQASGKMNLRPWIENQIEGSVLHKASEYFRQAANPKLEEAKQVLGYDLDTLDLCKLYAGQVEEPTPIYG